jgi:hypothetical protein
MPLSILKDLLKEDFSDDEIEATLPFEESLDIWEYEKYNSESFNQRQAYRKAHQSHADVDKQLANLVQLSKSRREVAATVSS